MRTDASVGVGPADELPPSGGDAPGEDSATLDLMGHRPVPGGLVRAPRDNGRASRLPTVIDPGAAPDQAWTADQSLTDATAASTGRPELEWIPCPDLVEARARRSPVAFGVAEFLAGALGALGAGLAYARLCSAHVASGQFDSSALGLLVAAGLAFSMAGCLTLANFVGFRRTGRPAMLIGTLVAVPIALSLPPVRDSIGIFSLSSETETKAVESPVSGRPPRHQGKPSAP